MYLAPTAEQQELKDAVRRFCLEQITPERLAAWDKEPGGIDDDCWRQVTALGWLGLGLPPAAGGSGLGLVEAACLLEECARGLVPRRVINAIRGGLALTLLSADNAHLPAVGRGERTVTVALDERNARAAAAYETRLIATSDGAQLVGEKCYVADAAQADLHVVAACEPAGVVLVLASADKATVTPLRTFDGECQGIVRYNGVGAQRLTAPGQGVQALAALRRQQTALALAEMVGGMDAVLAMTVDYVKQREQFGQKIAVFQAVQHQVADMATAFTAARHLAWQAVTRLAAQTEEGVESAHAAAFVGQAFKRLTLTALHLHGGAGYVVEHPLHYHAERAQSLCIRYTPEAAALAEVAAALLDAAQH
jgi:alkylation response protein AidB-like acyl-CoA dehydrogenase